MRSRLTLMSAVFLLAVLNYSVFANTYYIDFKDGDDSNAGTKEEPWKHHPWDPNATGTAAEASGPNTYVFKKGVVYRGALLGDESGKPGDPVVLTSDGAWGDGGAAIYGSVRPEGEWKKATAETAPGIPKDVVDKVWYLDTDFRAVPQAIHELDGDHIKRMEIAREPDWTITDPDNPREHWWEWQQYVYILPIEVESTEGFEEGDKVRGFGEWHDPDEERLNIDEGETYIGEIIDEDTMVIEIHAFKRGEYEEGVYISNGEAMTEITGFQMNWNTDELLTDPENLTNPDPSYYEGARLWQEGLTMANPFASHVQKYDPEKNQIQISFGPSEKRGRLYCRYFLEDLPHFLDEPGEWYYDREKKRLFVRMFKDKNPNEAHLEISQLALGLSALDCSNIRINGLEFAFQNPIDYGKNQVSRYPNYYSAAIRMPGSVENIEISYCDIHHTTTGISFFPYIQGQSSDGISIIGNRVHQVQEMGISVDFGRKVRIAGGQSELFHKNEGYPVPTDLSRDVTRIYEARCKHVKVADNNLHKIGFLAGSRGTGIAMLGVEMAEASRNRIDLTWGHGIDFFAGGSFSRTGLEFPLMRNFIRHNHITNTLLALQDYGGIEYWFVGPTYIYNNISGNAVGSKYADKKAHPEKKDWYRTGSYAQCIYLDQGYKTYVFNNILWGQNNDVNDWIYNSTAVNEASGVLNTHFNNTMFRVGIGFHRGTYIFDRCIYLNNLMLDIGHRFIQQETRLDELEFQTLAYANNIMHGDVLSFGFLGAQGAEGWMPAETIEEWREGLRKRNAMKAETGQVVEEPPVVDMESHDFTPLPDSPAIDGAAKVFVPWGLYRATGEWNFFMHEEDPSIVTDTALDWTDRFVTSRHMGIKEFKRNNLHGQNIDRDDLVMGELETWTKGAARLNGEDQYFRIPAEECLNLDVGDGNFLIEAYIKIEPDSKGAIVSKMDESGYELAVNGEGNLVLSIAASESVSASAEKAIDDGEFHHVLVEVERDADDPVRFFLDGEKIDSAIGGEVAGKDLTNKGDFLVGRSSDGQHLAATIDFLRLSLGSLEDAETTIRELYEWQFYGPFLRDFHGNAPRGDARDVGAIEMMK